MVALGLFWTCTYARGGAVLRFLLGVRGDRVLRHRFVEWLDKYCKLFRSHIQSVESSM